MLVSNVFVKRLFFFCWFSSFFLHVTMFYVVLSRTLTQERERRKIGLHIFKCSTGGVGGRGAPQELRAMTSRGTPVNKLLLHIARTHEMFGEEDETRKKNHFFGGKEHFLVPLGKKQTIAEGKVRFLEMYHLEEI